MRVPDAWSTNEIAIDWNAPVVWVTAWLDEHAKERHVMAWSSVHRRLSRPVR